MDIQTLMTGIDRDFVNDITADNTVADITADNTVADITADNTIADITADSDAGTDTAADTDSWSPIVIVRGGGDLASGTVLKLYRSGFTVLVLETGRPSSIRRKVSFSEAVYEGSWTVEGVTCYLSASLEEAIGHLKARELTVLVDPAGDSIRALRPFVLVDAILAKKNLGTGRDMAGITIGLGPGFCAGEDVDAVIETMRGHNLGRVIYQGTAQADTGIPGLIKGFGRERVIYSPAGGRLECVCQITDQVSQGNLIAWVIPDADKDRDIATDTDSDSEPVPVYAPITGILRGMLRSGYPVNKGFKMADIDPRTEEYDNCFTVSDKARCIGGGVLEAILYLLGTGKTS